MENLERPLAAHPFLAGLPTASLKLLAPCTTAVTWPAGQTVITEGDEARHLYLLRSGRVALSIHRPRRGQRTVYTLGEGEVVGMCWLDLPQQSFFDVQAVELTRALALDLQCLQRLAAAHPDLGYELLQRYVRVLTYKLKLLKLQLVDFYGS